MAEARVGVEPELREGPGEQARLPFHLEGRAHVRQPVQSAGGPVRRPGTPRASALVAVPRSLRP